MESTCPAESPLVKALAAVDLAAVLSELVDNEWVDGRRGSGAASSPLLNRADGLRISTSRNLLCESSTPLVEERERTGFTVLIAIEGCEQPVLAKAARIGSSLVEERVPWGPGH